jgi:hypothetical protein
MNKEKPLRLKQAIKNRKTEAFNADFFNNTGSDNFIPLAEKHMNFDNNYDTNYNQYNQGYY